MKKFSNYQYVEGVPMLERDKQEIGSKFWNKGKWDNFVLPLLPDDCKEMTLVDMGCNAGIFLELAEKKGFKKVIGVDANREAVRRAIAYRDRIKGGYDIRKQYMEKCIDTLPMADYTVLANAHYYFPINDWLDYLDKLWSKTHYVIIVTAIKRPKSTKAASDSIGIKNYFKNWEEVKGISELSLEGDSFPRRLWSLCFKNPIIDRVSMGSLDLLNISQIGFYADIDKGIDPFKTQYFASFNKGHRKGWSEDRKKRFVLEKASLFKDIEKNGLLRPIIIDFNKKIVDGNHRFQMLKHLGHETVLVRKG